MSCNHIPKPLTRRQALSMVGGGMGMVALSNMVSTSLEAATPEMVGTKGALPQLHFKPKAKRHFSFHERRRLARGHLRL